MLGFYTCPISFEAPRVPVITNACVTYDFSYLAQWLLRNNTNTESNINIAIDPVTQENIDTFIYNRSTKDLNDALMDEVLPLSNEEKIEIASLYIQLIRRYPSLRIIGIHALEGMQVLIETANVTLQRPEFEPGFVASDGQTSLYLAAEEGYINVVHVLLADTRVDPNEAMNDGSTPLMIAVQNRHINVVRALLADIRIDPTKAAYNGATPLFLAAQNGYTNVVHILLADTRVNPNQAMFDGTTPLYTAVLFGHFDVVRALLSHHLVRASTVLANAADSEYPAFLRVLLSDEDTRDYYLNQIIQKPGLMQDAFIKNPIFSTELAVHRNKLWDRLRNAAHLNLQPDEYRTFLRAILNSQQEPDEARHNPLYTLFKTTTPRARSLTSFSTCPPIDILDEIRVLVDTPPSSPNLG